MKTPLKSQETLKEILNSYFQGLKQKQAPVAWCTSVGPAELLRSFGFDVYFPENHGALLGARRLGSKYIPVAAQEGFSSDICSYLTSDIGAFLMKETPLKGYGMNSVPTPDVLVYNTNQCREVKEWFSFYGQTFNKPVLGIETPRDIDQPTQPLLSYLKSSWEELIHQLEIITGQSFNPTEFSRIVELSHQACKLWQDFLESNRKKPVGHTFFDHVFLMAPVVVLRGTSTAVSFYKELLKEVSGIYSSPENEKYRFYWEGMPIWGKIRFLSELCEQHKVKIVTSTYCHSWAFDFTQIKGDTLLSCVKAYADIFITRSQEFKMNYLKEVTERFSIDAVLFHDSKTCPYNTNSRFGLPSRFKKETGLPVFVFYGDLVDIRHFSEEEFAMRLEAFIEQL